METQTTGRRTFELRRLIRLPLFLFLILSLITCRYEMVEGITLDGKKSLFIDKFKVVLMDKTKDILELKASNFFIKNKLKRVYYDLKEIQKPLVSKDEDKPKGFY